MDRVERPGLPSPALVGFCNAVPSVLWSLLCFLPVSTFCTLYIHPLRLFAFGAVSLLVYAVPTSQFRHVELSARPDRYRRLGIPLVNRWVQHGTIVNGLLRRVYPGYVRLRSRTQVSFLKRSTYKAERFHWATFLFFLLCSVSAAAGRHPGWALLILLTNALYNLYPIWLQQYLRLRLRRVSG